MVWDVGTRGPLRVLRDIGAGFTSLRTLTTGFVRLLVGVVAIAIAGVVLLPVFLRSSQPTIVESLTLVTGLIVESLIGTDLRARVFAKR